jgi:hypothetical protein
MKRLALILAFAMSLMWTTDAQAPAPTINGTPPPFLFTGAVTQTGQTFNFTGGGGAPTGPAGGVLSGAYPNPGAASPQAVTITADAGVDPTHGGTAACATSLGFVCTSTYGVVKIVYGTTPADQDVFSVSWASAKSTMPIVLAAPALNSVTTAAWAFAGYPAVQDSDTTTTTKASVSVESATGGTLAGQIAYVAYHIDPVLP